MVFFLPMNQTADCGSGCSMWPLSTHFSLTLDLVLINNSWQRGERTIFWFIGAVRFPWAAPLIPLPGSDVMWVMGSFVSVNWWTNFSLVEVNWSTTTPSWYDEWAISKSRRRGRWSSTLNIQPGRQELTSPALQQINTKSEPMCIKSQLHWRLEILIFKSEIIHMHKKLFTTE